MERDFPIRSSSITAQTLDKAVGKDAVSKIGVFMGVLVFLARRQCCPAFCLHKKDLFNIRLGWCCTRANTSRMAGLEKSHYELCLVLTKVIINHIHRDPLITDTLPSELLC